MGKSLAPRVLVASALLLVLGIGCGSAGGGACGGLRPLPSGPAPLGFPSDQLIEGGIQARIAKPGMDKLVATIPQLIGKNIAGGFCAAKKTGLTVTDVCDANDCAGNTQGCPAFVYLDSKQRPSSSSPSPPFPPGPGNREDNKDKIVVTVNDSTASAPPTITVHATFDVLVPVHVSTGNCYVYGYNSHLTDDVQQPIDLVVNIELGVDPTTGELTLHLAQNNPITINNLGLQTDSNGVLCGIASFILNPVVGFISGTLQSFVGQFIINLLRPQLDALLQSFLPKPPGLAGVLDAAALLGAFQPPKDAHLEIFTVAGGYVATKAGGLTLGVMSGLNSDRDETTRGPGLTSEPSLCVPARPTPKLDAPPWMLPANPARKDFLLSPAGEFSGSPDPVDNTGAPQDVAIGLSRTFLDLAGFHIFNSGALCLTVGGATIPQLTTGTLSIVVASLANIVEDRKAPLILSLRPENPLTFTVGAGTMADPLVHIGVSDLRIDLYAWIEERFVRLLTLSVDLDAGLNLTFTKTPDGKPAIQPTLVNVDAQHVKIRASNTDLLTEDHAALEAVFPSLINVATSSLGGALKPIALPQVAGFSLDNLLLQKVHTTQDDFVALYGSIKTGGARPTLDVAPTVRTLARVQAISVPPAASLRALFVNEPILGAAPARPTVTLDLATDGTGASAAAEYAWRVDGGMWRPWTTESHPVLADDAFLLQGHHGIDVRARLTADWRSEDPSPVHLEVLIDSVPPELHPARDATSPTQLVFGGYDLVSETAALEYAWRGADGRTSAWSAIDHLAMADALALTRAGRAPLILFARDEAGNVGEAAVDVGLLDGFHGRTTAPPSAGCGCSLGGAHAGQGRGVLLVLLGLGLLILARSRQWRRATPLALAVALGALATGCGCDNKAAQCRIDDDCAKMTCAANQFPQCQASMCICAPDLPLGDVGRFAAMTLVGQDAYVAAYNNTYGDLMVGHVRPPGVVPSWDFVDGVPSDGPDAPQSHVRGGVSGKGDDVGRYASIQSTAAGAPIIAYYDKTHGSLKFASFGVVRWDAHTVDKGAPTPEGSGDDLGRWASLSVGPDQLPGIAYTATVARGDQSGAPEGQLRWAQAKVPLPRSAADWTITVVDSRPLPQAGAPPPDGGVTDAGASQADAAASNPDAAASNTDAGASTPGELLLPEGIALMSATARKPDGSPAIAYYDRTRGNLRYVERLPSSAWSTPILLDGEDPMGGDTGDVGQYPSLAFDEKGVAHISYVDATHDNLLYVNSMSRIPEVVDDGYRSKDEQTMDGLNAPVYHLVGDSSSIQTVSGQVVIAYQDSTVLTLRMAQKSASGAWMTSTVAGHATPFKGSYGFYANLRISGRQGIVSSYAINQQLASPLFFVEVFAIDLGILM